MANFFRCDMVQLPQFLKSPYFSEAPPGALMMSGICFKTTQGRERADKTGWAVSF